MKSRSIGVLGKTYVIELLETLLEKPRRFVDLSKCCPNDRTKSVRLKELKKAGLIKTIILEVREQSFIHYSITKKGEEALRLLQQLERLIMEEN